ncbi:MAG: GNAT family N-acetyltransferase [Candidatus Xenobia bacterium]
MIPCTRLRLWALEKFDLSKNYHWGNDPELISFTGMSPYPKSLWEIEKWYEGVLTNANARLFTIKTNEGEYIGNIELNSIDWRVGKCELGLMLGEKTFWNQGWGAEAIQGAVKFAFEHMRMERVSARVLDFNLRAQKCFEKCGFKREGVERHAFFAEGRYHDIVMFGILRGELPPSASAPVA